MDVSHDGSRHGKGREEIKFHGDTDGKVRLGHRQQGRASWKRWLRFRVGRIMHPSGHSTGWMGTGRIPRMEALFCALGQEPPNERDEGIWMRFTRAATA